MSFAVISGASPHVGHGLSPHANVYSVGLAKTPSSLPRAPVAGLPPPFSLSATNGNDLVDMLGSAPNGSQSHAKRIGTDPAKFKTTICRNWEQTGMCSFRGCTFAHGVDDLRPPMRHSGVSSGVGERGVSPTLGPKVSPNASPSIHASAVHNAGHSSNTKLDSLIEQLLTEISKDKDLSLVHQEASRTLEAMIRREQLLRHGSSQHLETQSKRLGALLRKLSDKDRSLSEAIQRAHERGVSSSLLTSGSVLLEETQSVVQVAEACLLENGVCTKEEDECSHESECEDKMTEQSCGEQKNNQPRTYAAAVTGQRIPIGLRPIGGSPTDSPRDSPI